MMDRYDLEVGVQDLDLESVIALISLSDLWQARARLRQRWMARRALAPQELS